MSEDDSEFKAWMQKVDKLCTARFGVSVHDLPDMCFRDAFDSEETPRDFVNSIDLEDL